MVSGLHNCYELTELYLNYQNFQDSAQGIGMLFDRDSMIGVSDS
jgi:hypothetical protein